MGRYLFLIYWVECTFVPVHVVKENEVQLHSFFTLALYGVNGHLHAPDRFTSKKESRHPLNRRLCRPVWTLSEKKSLTLPGNQTTLLLAPSCECCILSFGRFPESEFYVPTFRNNLFLFIGRLNNLWRWYRRSVPKSRHRKFRRRRITKKKEYNYFVCSNVSRSFNEASSAS